MRGGRVLLGDVSEARVADVLIDAEKIRSIGPDLPTGDATILDATGCLVLPGLVNAHFHSSELLIRGRYDGLSFDHWGVYAYPFLYNPPLPQRLVYLRTLLAGIELLRNGTTAVTDDVASEVAGQELETLESVFSAYDDLGLRANVSGNVMNLSQEKTWPFGSAIPARVKRAVAGQSFPTVSAYLELCEEAIRRFHEANGLRRFVVAPVAPQWCTPELIMGAGELAARHNLNFHMHVLETRWQAEVSAQWQSGGFIPYLRNLGVLNERTTLIHGVWLRPSDIELIAAADATVVHCPVANLRLGVGIAPVKQLLRNNVTVGLGTDGLALHETPSILGEARVATLISRVLTQEPAEWMLAHESLHAATAGGARTMLTDKTSGKIAVGRAADLIVIRENELPTDSASDVRNRLIFGTDPARIDTVIVGGRVVFAAGVPTRVDEEQARAELLEYVNFVEGRQNDIERHHAKLAAFFAQQTSDSATHRSRAPLEM